MYDHFWPFFAIFIFVFHKTEVQKVILRCSTGLNLDWFKSYGLRCSLRLRASSVAFSRLAKVPYLTVDLCYKRISNDYKSSFNPIFSLFSSSLMPAWKFHNLKHFLTHRRRRGLTPEALTASDSEKIGAHLRRLVSFISSNQSRWGPKTRILSWIQRWENLIGYFQFVSIIKNPNQITKGQSISKSAYGVIIWSKIPCNEKIWQVSALEFEKWSNHKIKALLNRVYFSFTRTTLRFVSGFYSFIRCQLVLDWFSALRNSSQDLGVYFESFL